MTDPYIYYLQSRWTSLGDERKLTIFFETAEDNTVYRNAWQDMDANGRVSDGDQFMSAPLLEGEPEWESISKRDKAKFGKFIASAVKDWGRLLEMWKKNAKRSDCGQTETGEEFLAMPGNANYWIRNGGDFLLFRPVPPPIGRREVANISADSPDRWLIQSAFEQCIEATMP